MLAVVVGQPIAPTQLALVVLVAAVLAIQLRVL
jgi:hypothetical protein